MNKIRLSDIRKMGACNAGCDTFKQYFPRGADFTYETALKVAQQVPACFIYWWLENFINKKVADRYYVVLDHAIDRVYSTSSWKREYQHVARWLLKNVQKYLQEGGDAKSK